MPKTIEAPPAPAAGEVVLKRLFDAPRERVFRAWSDPEALQRWYAPAGCTIEIRRLEFRTGGEFHTCIRNPAYHDCWCSGVYREIAAPERIVMTMWSADETGNRVEPADVGMDPDWPQETTVTVTFSDQGGKTLLTLHQTVSESLARRTGAYPSWISMFDRLASQLATN